MPDCALAATRGKIVGDDEATRQARLKSERENRLRNAVLDKIGVPEDLCRVDTRELHDRNHYRVNILRWRNGRPTIIDSFYIEVTHDGLVSSPPLLKKHYTWDELEHLANTTRRRS